MITHAPRRMGTTDGHRELCTRSLVRSVAVAVAVMLGAPASLAAAPRSRSASARKQVDASEVDAAIAAAEGHYNAGRYMQAARAFEALETRGAQYLYYAGLAYEALEHDAKAILLWAKVVGAFEVREELRAEARVRLDAARARTTRLRMTVDPPAAAEGALVELEYQSAGARDKLVLSTDELREGVHLEGGLWTLRVRSPSKHHGEAVADIVLTPNEVERRMTLALPELTQKVTLAFSPPVAGLHVTLIDPAGTSHAYDVTQGRHAGQLKRGTWKYRAEAPGYAPLEGTLEVADVDITRALQLRVRPRPANLRPLAISAGVTSALVGVGGAVGLALSEQELYHCKNGGTDGAKCSKSLLDRVGVTAAAAGVAVGLLITVVTATSHSQRGRRRGWIGELIAGSLFSAGGGLLIGYQLQTWRDDFPKPWREQNPGLVAGCALAGVGSALVLGSIIGTVTERRARQSGARAAGGPFASPIVFRF